MSNDANPYAAPRANPEGDRAAEDAFRRDGRTLVMRNGAAFPMRCVKCNAPAAGAPYPRELAWRNPAWNWTMLLVVLVPLNPIFGMAPLLAITLGELLRKMAEVNLRLCWEHGQRLRVAQRLLSGGAAALLPCYVYAFASLLQAPLPWTMPPGVIMAVFASTLPWGIAVGLLRRTVTAGRISENEVRLKGCGEAFLASLPPVENPAPKRWWR